MEEKIKHQWLVMLCALIAAFSLWFYTTNLGNVIKTRDIVVSVEMENQDALTKSGLVMLPDQNLTINLKIRGKAPGIYAVDAKQFKVVMDMNEYVLKKGLNPIPVTVSNKPADIDILNDEVLKADIELDKLNSKNVPVEFVQEGTPKAGYYPAKAILKPTDVLVSGPDKYVSTVKSVIVNGSIKNAEGDVNLSISPQAVDDGGKPVSNIKFNVDVIDVIVPMKKSKSVGINIKTKNNIGKDVFLKSIEAENPQVTIISKDNMDNITSLDTEAIDLSGINESKTIDAKLIVPNGVELSGDSIAKIKIQIEKSTQKNLSIDIQNKNLNKDCDLTLETPKASIIVSGAESIINDLKPEDVTAVIDLNSLDEGTYSVPLTVSTKLKGVNIISSSPQVVKATVTKKKTPAKTDDSSQVYTTNGGKGETLPDKKSDDTTGKTTKDGQDGKSGGTDNSGSTKAGTGESNKEAEIFTINGIKENSNGEKGANSGTSNKTSSTDNKAQSVTPDKNNQNTNTKSN